MVVREDPKLWQRLRELRKVFEEHAARVDAVRLAFYTYARSEEGKLAGCPEGGCHTCAAQRATPPAWCSAVTQMEAARAIPGAEKGAAREAHDIAVALGFATYYAAVAAMDLRDKIGTHETP